MKVISFYVFLSSFLVFNTSNCQEKHTPEMDKIMSFFIDNILFKYDAPKDVIVAPINSIDKIKKTPLGKPTLFWNKLELYFNSTDAEFIADRVTGSPNFYVPQNYTRKNVILVDSIGSLESVNQNPKKTGKGIARAFEVSKFVYNRASDIFIIFFHEFGNGYYTVILQTNRSGNISILLWGTDDFLE